MALLPHIQLIWAEFVGVVVLKAKVQNTKKKGSPMKTMRAAEQLLKKGDTDRASAYFWYAGNTFRELEEYELSASAYEKAAYCDISENRLEKAVEDYLLASKMYEHASLFIKAEAMKRNAEKVRVI
jgi:tetratricopeptide (TPR) repeat protein